MKKTQIIPSTQCPKCRSSLIKTDKYHDHIAEYCPNCMIGYCDWYGRWFWIDEIYGTNKKHYEGYETIFELFENRKVNI
jgi:hypothetical protein